MGPRKEPQPKPDEPNAAARLVQRQRGRGRTRYRDLEPPERVRLDRDRVGDYRLEVSATNNHKVFNDEIKPDVWDYANRSLPKLIASGEVFAIRSRAGGPHFTDLVMPRDGIGYDLAQDLAADTIIKALPRFQESVLLEWDGYREDTAALGTYFIGLCSLVFPGPFRKWQREASKLHSVKVFDPDMSISSSHAWDAPESVVYDIEFNRHIELIDNPTEKLIVRLDSIDLTDRRIAEVLSLTEKQVEYRLKKTRSIGQARWEEEHSMDDFRGTELAVA